MKYLCANQNVFKTCIQNCYLIFRRNRRRSSAFAIWCWRTGDYLVPACCTCSLCTTSDILIFWRIDTGLWEHVHSSTASDVNTNPLRGFHSRSVRRILRTSSSTMFYSHPTRKSMAWQYQDKHGDDKGSDNDKFRICQHKFWFRISRLQSEVIFKICYLLSLHLKQND